VKDVIKVVLVDDHVILRSGIASMLKTEPIEIIFEADNGQDMIEKLKSVKKSSFPDVFIIDINMPVMDGLETTEWLIQNYPNSKIIILTMYNKPAMVMKAIKLGVKSYLIKDISPTELIAAVKAVNNNKLYFPEDITRIIIESHKNFENQSYSETNNIPNLTDRESQLLKLMCTEMTYSEIAKELNVSPRTVDAFRDNLFEKFKVKSRVGLVLLAIKKNIITDNE
jgi:DNA-binding NarL/FixJ family response regulator